MNWIEQVVESTKDAESPERYWWWAALSAISAVVRKNVWLDRGGVYKLYANTYVVLVSKRSGLRKGIPITLAQNLLNIVSNTRIMGGIGSSIEGIIKELSTVRTFENGLIMSEAQGIILTGELDALLASNDRALTYLTAMQNTHEHDHGIKKHLVGSPLSNMKNPCICLLGASNEVLFDDLVRAKDREGGFLARTFIVYESKRRGTNSLVNKVERVPTKVLASRLFEIANLQGEFKYDNGAGEFYDKWYHKMSNLEHDDKTGSMERLGDQVLKAAMLISLSEKDELVLTKHNIDEAIDKGEECITGTNTLSFGKGDSDIAKFIAKVLKLLINSPDHSISRQKLQRKMWPDIDHFTLDRVIITIQDSGGIVTKPPKVRSEGVIYEMPLNIVEQYREFQEKRGL
jgi:hypothetical protein